MNYELKSESCMWPLAPSGAAVPAGERFASAESPRLNRPELSLVPKELSWPWFPAAMLGSPEPPASSLRKLLSHRDHPKPALLRCVWV